VSFVAVERRARFRESLRSPKGRRKLYDELYHFEQWLDPEAVSGLEPHSKHDEHVADVCARLVEERAPPTSFVFATTELDGQEAPIADAVAGLMWNGAGFISCIPGRLGLYVGEDGSNVVLLQPVASATRATTRRHSAGISAASSVYCEGLKQNEV